MLHPLTIDTGPEFRLDVLAEMSFGHPGFSALEFAGCQEKERDTVRLALRDKSQRASKSDEEDVKSIDTVVAPAPGTSAESENAGQSYSIPLPPPELVNKQRRRGTFINHTPRDFEVRLQSKCDLRVSTAELEAPNRPNVNEVDNNALENDQHHENPVNDCLSALSTAQRRYKVEVGCKSGVSEQRRQPLSITAPAISKDKRFRQSEQKSSATNNESPLQSQNSMDGSIRSSLVGTTHVSNLSGTSETTPLQQPKNTQNTAKRRRRQTPFKLSAPKLSSDGRHSPLEPLVAYHRREASGDNRSVTATTSEPKLQAQDALVDGDIGEVSASRAIQEYFDSQASTTSSVALPEPGDTENGDHASNEPTPTFPMEDLAIPCTPTLPNRNPKRLDTASTSFSGEFTSATESECSPNATSNPEAHALMIPKRRAAGTRYPAAQLAAKAGSSILGRMAPPILGHEALTATADLNDLSYYLKHTGPIPEPQDRPRRLRKSSFKVFKVGRNGKGSLAARVGSVEGSPNSQKKRQERRIPACAAPMTTSSGTKHLRIVIPSDDFLQEQMVKLPVEFELEESDAKVAGCSGRVSIIWTEEMLNPLASPELENVISGFDHGDDEEVYGPGLTLSHSTPARSPKRERISSECVPVEEHPLQTRQDVTRARKLRDLKRAKTMKGRVEEGQKESANTTPSLADIDSGLTPEYAEGKEEEDSDTTFSEAAMLKKRVVSLQRQNTALAEALAKIVGFQTEDGDLDSDAVLRAYRQIKTGSGDSGYGYVQRGGRVFTA